MRIKQDFFSGERPRVASHLSKEYEAQIAENCDLSRGDLRPLAADIRTKNLTEVGTLKTLYQWKKTGDDEWIVNASELDFVRSPIAGEAHDRVYLTGMTEPRVLTNSIVSVPFDFSTDYYKLGVPAPAAALTIDAGYATASTYRAYLYTYVVKLGVTDAEEGSNSAIASISNYGSGNVTLSGFAAPPAGRSIGKIRIYRTASGSSGVGEFLFVGEFDTDGVDFAAYTFTDDVADADLGEAFTCENWTPPPSTLAGIISVDGGSLAGFVGNRVYVTEPYLPHAWPYSYPVDSTIVGLGSIGNTIVVMTDEFIYLLYGQADAMSTKKLSGRYPCLSKAGVVSCESGVLFPSDEGIVLVTPDGPTLLSYDYFTKKQYMDNYTPTGMRSIFHNGQYFCFHDTGAFSINIRDKSLIRMSMPALGSAVPHVSLANNHLYFISQDIDNVNAIYDFGGDTDEGYKTYLYRSKDFILGAVANFSAARVIRDLKDYGAINAALFLDSEGEGTVNGAAVNGDAVNSAGLQKVYLGVTLHLYGDGVLLMEKQIINDNAFRLPSGILYRRCYFEIIGDTPICEVSLATSMEELDAA
jgi:hypothetical protein